MHRVRRTRPIRRCRASRRSANRPSEECCIAFGRGVSAKLRSAALGGVELYCQMCGVIPGDIDELTGRAVRFHIGKIKPRKLRGGDEVSNLQVLCSTCHRGAKELRKERMLTAQSLQCEIRDA